MKKALMKDTIKEITHNFKRFISMLLIVLLGVGFFAGIKATSPDMKKTLDKYFDEQNVMDIQLLSTLGLTKSDIEELKKVEGVEQVEGGYSSDAIVKGNEKEVVVKLMSLPITINQVTVVEGRLPENEKECVVEPLFLTGTNYQIGDTITIEVEDIQDDEGEEKALLKQKEVEIVGTVRSPLYISSDRGTTKLGSGKINYYIYTTLENVNTDIRTVAYLTVDDGRKLKTYGDQYEDIVEKIEDKIEEISEERRQARYQEIYDKANSKIEDAQKELDEQKKILNQFIAMYGENLPTDMLKQKQLLEEAEKDIEVSKEKLADIKKPDWYILNRNQNVGYVSYLQETDRIANISKVFPVVFFVVAALISLTSMTRMVEEQRVQIGTLKGLGYGKVQIASKYIIYATLATVIGGIIGMTIGFYLIPNIICDMYGMMYTLPEAILEFNTQYAVVGMLVACFCTVGATIYSCLKALVHTPASLMRPKAPKPGKRVFLEKIPFIWKHLNFTKKVTARNIFRYKKRFLMTIIGIAGCTSLIVAGFGLRDAVSDMIPSQYGNVFKYNLQITLKDNLKAKDIQKACEKIESNKTIKNTIKANMQSIELVKNDNNQSIQLIVPEDVESLHDFIQLENRKTKESYTLNTNGVIITEKLATLLDIKKEDSITIKNADDVEAQVKVEGIAENYLQHYIYMSSELYQQLYQEEMKPNTVFAITDNMAEEQEDVLGKEILSDKEAISSIVFTSMTKDIFAKVMDKMTVVVWILIIAAGLLAFVVLYNLSNANISERIRELATIKVLGFYDKEVYDYVGKETIILTILGILFGLLGGTFLTTFIIKTCELDAFMFNPEIKVTSYLYGIIITFVFASIVNITTYFALKKINMIESLKSVE